MAEINPLDCRYTAEQVTGKRKAVREALIKASPNINGAVITKLAERDLQLLFALYDAVFLGSFFKQNFKGELTFSLSTRMSRSAGKVLSPRNLAELPPDREKYELRLSVDFFFHFADLHRIKEVNGIATQDALEAMQLVFEHELCHLLELHLYKQTSCRRGRFKLIAGNLFGHTESYHRLPTMREIAGEKYGLSVGDSVCFSCGEQMLEGVISAINKRATVMVRDPKGDYRDHRGRRYAKWYVPLTWLKKIRK